MRTAEEITQTLLDAGIDSERAKALAGKIAPTAPAPTEAEAKAATLQQLRTELRSMPQLGGFAPEADRISQAIAREKILKQILALTDYAPRLGGGA